MKGIQIRLWTGHTHIIPADDDATLENIRYAVSELDDHMGELRSIAWNTPTGRIVIPTNSIAFFEGVFTE